MPALKTFQNLPPDRQQEIILVCLEEFALHEYETASLSTIIDRLTLAKGSFYRYFDNKQSLYLFLLQHCTDLRLRNDEAYVDDGTTDLFELIKQHFMAKIQFDRLYPLHSAFLYTVLQEKNNDELGNIQLISKQKAIDVIKTTVTRQIEAKALRQDIEPDIMALTIFQVQLLIVDYIALVYHIDFRERIRNHERLYDLPEDILTALSGQFTDLLKNGLIHPSKK